MKSNEPLNVVPNFSTDRVTEQGKDRQITLNYRRLSVIQKIYALTSHSILAGSKIDPFETIVGTMAEIVNKPGESKP